MWRVLLLLSPCSLACQSSGASLGSVTTGTGTGQCGSLYEEVQGALLDALASQEAVDGCEEPCPDLAESLVRAMLLYADAYTDWSDCDGGLF